MLFRAHRYLPDGPELTAKTMEGKDCEELNRKWGLGKG